jgi:hypothetical protein
MTTNLTSKFPTARAAPLEKITRASESGGVPWGVSGPVTYDTKIPQARTGFPVVSIMGQNRVDDPNVLWVGPVKPLYRDITTGIITSENTVINTQTQYIVGYVADIHIGICLGPGVTLLAIYVESTKVWEGSAGPERSFIDIPVNDTFISGTTAVFTGGAFDQIPEPVIDVLDYTAYVGVSTILIQNARFDGDFGKLSFEVTREPNRLNLDFDVNIKNGDINVSSAIVELLTNEWGFGGVSLNRIDLTAFEQAALVLAQEENFCRVKIGKEVSVSSVLKELQKQGNMVVYQSAETGLTTCELVRIDTIDYVSTVNKFSPDNVISLQSFTKTGWVDTNSNGAATYISRADNYLEQSVYAENVSNSEINKNLVIINYPYVSNSTLALKLLSEELISTAYPLIYCSIQTTRDGAPMELGRVITLTWPDYQIVDLPMMVVAAKKHPIDINTVTLDLREIQTDLSIEIVGKTDLPKPINPDVSVKAAIGGRVISAPYYLGNKKPFYFAGSTTVGIDPILISNAYYSIYLPIPANEYQTGFSATINLFNNDVANVSYPTKASLVSSINFDDNFATGIIPLVEIYFAVNPSNLRSVGIDGIRQGLLLIFINNEILSCESVNDIGGGVYELVNVHRALIDTVPENHLADDEVYVIGADLSLMGTRRQHATGIIDTNIVSRTLIDSGFTFGVPNNSFVLSHEIEPFTRVDVPARPHNTKINGVRTATSTALTIGGSVTVSWTGRSRVAPAIALMADPAKIETGQLHKVWYRPVSGADVPLTGYVTGSSVTFTLPALPVGDGFLYVEASHNLINPIGGVMTPVTYYSKYYDRVPIDVS